MFWLIMYHFSFKNWSVGSIFITIIKIEQKLGRVLKRCNLSVPRLKTGHGKPRKYTKTVNSGIKIKIIKNYAVFKKDN